MKLRSLRTDGFGRLAGTTFTFGPGLNVVVGPNEAGKSTLAAAIVASLYGLRRGEKERWRPWLARTYSTTLVYETADGELWEVQRAYEHDTKGVRVYDASGADVAARIGRGTALSPGEAHLRISADVFLQTACVRQRAVAIEAGAAGDVSSALAQALSGGPKEDAALGALSRLEDALRKHVGSERAHKNVPLKRLRELAQRQADEARRARDALASVAALREQIAGERAKRARSAHAASELDRRIQGLRAAHVRARLDALKNYHDEVAALQATRAQFDDVATFAADRVSVLDDAYHSWRSAESVAEAAARDLAEEALSEDERAELEQRRADAGTFDDDAFAALRGAAARSQAARARVAAASAGAAAARHDGDRGGGWSGALIIAALAAFATDVGVAIAHVWLWTAVLSALAIVLGVSAAGGARSRAAREREADAKQQRADAALAEERVAAEAVARVLEPLGIASIDELIRRRARYLALVSRERAAAKAAARAQLAHDAAEIERARFDALADAIVPDTSGDRPARRRAAQERAARRRERDGLDARLAMLAMQRGNILHGEDEFALHAEYEAVLASGVEPAAHDDAPSLRASEAERAELDLRAREAERLIAQLEGQLGAEESGVPDVAALDEALALTRAEIARIEAFEAAVKLARGTIEARKEEAHRGFARRLEEYTAPLVRAISGGRYDEIRLDPANLAIRVRIPENGAIEELERLSAGTRDQIALVVRFASARMFAEGLETPPLLLDDPFAYWDAERIARCLPVLFEGAATTQCILFTADAALADAAAAAGATRIALDSPLTLAPA